MAASSPSYSPFWPLQLLVLYLGVWIGYHVFELNEGRLATEDRIHQVIPQAETALADKKRLLALAENIYQLAGKDAAAAQLVKEFKIHGPTVSKPETSSATQESTP